MKKKQSVGDLPTIRGARIAIVQSKWHSSYVERMVKKCVDLLQHVNVNDIDIHVLPGCLELPLAAQRVIRRDRSLEAVIAFGAIIKGDTYHFEMVMQGCIRGLTQVMLDEDVPIIVEVLPVADVQQLEERCGDDQYNKGIEAAAAAAEIIHWRRENCLRGSR